MKWDGKGDLGRDILSGNILNKHIFERTIQLYLESLKVTNMSKQLNIIKPQISIDEYKTFWKKKKEETATSPFRLHIGHYKAALQKDHIINVHRIMLLIPFQTALVPNRWKKTVQTMLEKDPGHPWIHRLRIIELFDSQVNAGFQIFIGRKMVWSAVERNKLHESSYGSTPGKMAASAILQKVLCVDQLKLERRAGGMFDCDATGCYDRIIPPFASLHLQALGLASSIATFLARLIFVMERHVKTKHGISKESIKTTKNQPLLGIGQGNGGGPAIWLAHLTVMFTALSSICKGFTTRCVNGKKKLCTVGTGYVDDVTLLVTTKYSEEQTETQVKKRIKRMAKTWEKILHTTGGKLELSKCFWIPITWGWKKGRLKMRNKGRHPTELKIKESESGNKVRIKRISPIVAEKRLGVQYSLDGKWKEEYKHWKRYSKNFADQISKARLDRINGYHAYSTLWCSKFRYSCPVLGWNESQLSKVQKTIIGKSLSAAGYNSKMPRAVVFGPSQYGGMEWDSAIGILIYEQLKMLMGSLRLGDKVGKLLTIQLTWLQLIAGIETPILEETKQLRFLPNIWLTKLRDKLRNLNITIELGQC